MSVNKAFILGRVGKDPEIIHVNDVKKAAFTMATTDRGYTKQDGTVIPDRTEWHNIVAWRNLAEICEKYVHKGDLLFVEGKLTTRSWDKDGQRHYITEITAEVVELFPKQNPNPNPQQASNEFQPVMRPLDDDQPF